MNVLSTLIHTCHKGSLSAQFSKQWNLVCCSVSLKVLTHFSPFVLRKNCFSETLHIISKNDRRLSGWNRFSAAMAESFTCFHQISIANKNYNWNIQVFPYHFNAKGNEMWYRCIGHIQVISESIRPNVLAWSWQVQLKDIFSSFYHNYLDEDVEWTILCLSVLSLKLSFHFYGSRKLLI